MAAVQEEEYNGPAMTAHDWMYVWVGVVLAIVTAVEVLFYYLLKDGHIGSAFNVWALLIMAFTKFIIVAAFFMHLKFDSANFRRLFAAGAALAGFCYIAVLSAFGFFRGWYHWVAYGASVVIVAALVMRKPSVEAHGASDEVHAAH